LAKHDVKETKQNKNESETNYYLTENWIKNKQ